MDFFTINKKSYIQFFFILAATFLSFSLSAQCDNVTTGGTISSNQTLSAPGQPAPLLDLVPAAGGTGTIQYLWMETTISGASNSSTIWTIIPGANSADYQPPSLNETTYFIRCARRSGCTEYSKESNIITIEVIGSLPVELISFDAKAKGNSVSLNWVTGSEFNHDYFSLQHSTNGLDYSEISLIRGDGIDSDTKKEYTSIHRDANSGTNYYRLLQMDVDGKSTYSQVVKADIKFDTNISIAPNPSFDLMTVKVSELPQNAVILTLHHANSGQKLRTIAISEGQTNIQVDTDDLAPGMYIVQIISNNGNRLATAKFMKANR
jgi:hypothetical protein